MHVFRIVALSITFIIASGSKCRDISGLWRNQLNSNMSVLHDSGEVITGEYSTAVESRFRAAIISSNITGIFVPVEEGALLAFTVFFNHGKSLATWVGQCMECDGEEKLFTSWVLRTRLTKNVDRWMATRINHDTFVRVPDAIPRHLRTLGPKQKDEKSVTCEKHFKVGERGKWVDGVGDEFEITDCRESGIMTGVSYENEMIGRAAGEGRLLTVGLTSKFEDLIRGWAGHIYDDELDASWIEHTFVDNCRHPRRNTVFGVHSYSFDRDYEASPPKQDSVLTKMAKYFGLF